MRTLVLIAQLLVGTSVVIPAGGNLQDDNTLESPADETC